MFFALADKSTVYFNSIDGTFLTSMLFFKCVFTFDEYFISRNDSY